MNDENKLSEGEPPTQPVPVPEPTPEPVTEPIAAPPAIRPEPKAEPVITPAQQGEIASQSAENPPEEPAPESNEPAAPEEGEDSAKPAAEEEPVSPDKVFLFEEQQFEISEMPEATDDSDDGFATIPPGPTEEVDYDEDRARYPRRMRRERGRRRERMPAQETAAGAKPVAQPQPAAPRKYRAAIIIAIILLALLIIALVIWYNRPGRKAGTSEQPAGKPQIVSFVGETRHV